MRVLLVGSGGREHALAWKLSASERLTELHAAPGNPGIARHGACHPVRADDGEGLLGLARAVDADLVVIGPEAPLVAGVGDELRHAGISVFGPSRGAAHLEGSKSFAKEVMAAAGVPTARTLAVARPPCVVKADGLAAGKGVFVCHTQAELEAGLRRVAGLGGGVVIEELLQGDELSLFALVDGAEILPLPEARDYSRVGNGDTGPNTGGMGSYSPVPELAAEEVRRLIESIHRPVVDELSHRGTPFIGCLYAGVMLTDDGPRVLEFNCRFGDPETQAILPRIDGDLLPAIHAAATGGLAGAELEASPQAAVTVVLAAADYPISGDAGSEIAGLSDAEDAGALVFHAGTAAAGDRVVTNGGRILNVVGVGETIESARAVAYAGCERISFRGARFRRDIGLGVGERSRA